MKLKKTIEQKYPFLATKHYLGLAKLDKCSGILRQILPDVRELQNPSPRFTDDPQDEWKFSPVPKLIRRYPDRVVVLATNRCFIHCRFCFRKRLWKNSHKIWKISVPEIGEIAGYIKKNPEIREIIISGGDPLTLDDREIENLIKVFSPIKSIDAIRIGSRALAANPRRFTNSLIDILSLSDKIWLMSHFNHPAELSKTAKNRLRKITNNGIPVLNQTVLLKEINDDEKVLAELFRGLVACKVRPHYLFHVDPTKGNAHFVTGLDKALLLVDRLRGMLSSLAMPVFAVDLPEGGGKLSILPDHRIGKRALKSLNGGEFKYF